MATLTLLDPDDLRRWRACERRFWLQRREPLAQPREPAADADADAEAAVVYGPAPGAALRAGYPGALSIAAPATPATPAEWALAVQRTAAALHTSRLQSEGQAVFGACFASDDGARVRIDVLVRGAHGLRLFKVRYATIGDESDVDTVALWAHVAARCGLRVQSAGLLLVDTDFVYPGFGCYAGLLREVDLGPQLGSRPVAPWLVAMRACERGPQPAAEPGPQCTRGETCAFIARCRAADAASPAASPASLDIVGRELAAELRGEGHADLLSVPEERLADARHRRALRAVRAALPVIEPEVAQRVRALEGPRRLLRLDTIGFAVPVWPGTRPYQVLPFQWTCELMPAAQRLGSSRAYLAGADGDPRRPFAQSLLKALGRSGPVFAYNAGFERNRIRDLAQQFDDLAPALEALLPRIVDLFQIARAHFYHPAMCGSWSFKAIGRAIAPELQAERFECDGETSTQAAFARTLRRGLDPAAAQALRSALLAHGRRQTAMLRRLVMLFEGADGASRVLDAHRD